SLRCGVRRCCRVYARDTLRAASASQSSARREEPVSTNPPEGHDPYYREYARAYDEHSRGVPGDVEFYVALAREAGAVVELGVGTGRIAVPTAQAGVPVLGFDREPAMLEVAREKAEVAGVSHLVTLRDGDMRSFTLDAPVPLVTIP